MKSSSFSLCFLYLSLLATLVSLNDPMCFGKVPNQWTRLYLLNLRLNICIDNDSSRSSSNSSTCNIYITSCSQNQVNSYITKWARYFNAVNAFKQASSVCLPSSRFCFSRKVTSKHLPLVSCFVKSNFCWQSAETRLPHQLGSIYAKWLALNPCFSLRYFLVASLC